MTWLPARRVQRQSVSRRVRVYLAKVGRFSVFRDSFLGGGGVLPSICATGNLWGLRPDDVWENESIFPVDDSISGVMGILIGKIV